MRADLGSLGDRDTSPHAKQPPRRRVAPDRHLARSPCVTAQTAVPHSRHKGVAMCCRGTSSAGGSWRSSDTVEAAVGEMLGRTLARSDHAGGHPGPRSSRASGSSPVRVSLVRPSPGGGCVTVLILGLSPPDRASPSSSGSRHRLGVRGPGGVDRCGNCEGSCGQVDGVPRDGFVDCVGEAERISPNSWP